MYVWLSIIWDQLEIWQFLSQSAKSKNTTFFLFEVLKSFPAQHLGQPNEIQAFLSYSKLIGNGHLLCIKFLDFIIEWYIHTTFYIKRAHWRIKWKYWQIPWNESIKKLAFFFRSLSLKMKMKILTIRPCTFTIKHQIASHRVKNCAILEQFHAHIHWVYGL